MVLVRIIMVSMIDNPNLYEINTTVWLNELSQHHGTRITIGSVPAPEWDRLKEAGFHIIWLMGAWKRCRSGKEYFLADPRNVSLCDRILPGWTEDDIIGSPYAIESYEPDPLIGSWDDIDRAREELHKRDMKMILDFIPNHTGVDHPWLSTHPHYYIQVGRKQFEKNPSDFYPVRHNGKMLYLANGKDPYFLPWHDTVQLNYFNYQTRQAMVQEIKKIAGYCDGFRCDMAMLVLNDIFYDTWGWTRNNIPYESPEEEFWTEVRKAVPDSILIAEAYWDTEWELQQLGFDYAYDKRLYDRMASFSVRDIYLHLNADIKFQKKLTRFMENHDEKRSAEVFGKDRLEASLALLSTLPGMKLYYRGQMEGNIIRPPLQLRRIMREKPDMETVRLYEKLLSITNQEIFHKGQWRLLDVFPLSDKNPADLLAYTWKTENKIKLVVVNLNPSVAQSRIPLGDLVSDLLVDRRGPLALRPHSTA